MKNLTVVVPSHNNLDYLKISYESIRAASPTVPLIIFDDASVDGTYEWLSTLQDDNLVSQRFEKRMGHPYLYDLGFNMANTEYVGLIHSDMAVSKNFFNTLSSKLNKNKVVSATCVEPPLHGEGFEKLVKGFGMYPTEFDREGFVKFSSEFEATNQNVTTPSLFAPWFVHKETYFQLVGGHDLRYLPVGYDDSDLFIRMKKGGFTIEQCRDMLVYHFTQRGAKWTSGNVGKKYDDYDLQMQISQNRFLTKWGTLIWKDEQHHPSDIPLFYKRLVIKNYKPGENRNKYEFLNVFFNQVTTDEYEEILSDGLDHEINYEMVFDYDVNYDVNELQNFILNLPFVLKDCEEGVYESAGILIEVKHTNELSIREERFS